MATSTTSDSELVADPVSHISISGVHGRDELDERLSNAPDYRPPTSPLRPPSTGAGIGTARDVDRY